MVEEEREIRSTAATLQLKAERGGSPLVSNAKLTEATHEFLRTRRSGGDRDAMDNDRRTEEHSTAHYSIT
jgi:hypothetical protein